MEIRDSRNEALQKAANFVLPAVLKTKRGLLTRMAMSKTKFGSSGRPCHPLDHLTERTSHAREDQITLL
jgi:hypothetical protein